MTSSLGWLFTNTAISTTRQLGIRLLARQQHSDCSHDQGFSLPGLTDIQVLEAVKLNLLESEQEFEVGTLPLDLQFSAGLSFTSCASLPFTSFHTDSAFTTSIITSTQASCEAVEVAFSLVSHSKMTESWAYSTEINEKGTLEDSLVVASNSPLVPISPVTGETVLSIESDRLSEMRHLCVKVNTWTGGPQAWPLKPANYLKDLQIGKQTLLTVTPVSHKSLHVYKVTCLVKGDTKIRLTVGNKPSSTMPGWLMCPVL